VGDDPIIAESNVSSREFLEVMSTPRTVQEILDR